MPTVLNNFPNILNTVLTILSTLYFYHTFAKTKRKFQFAVILFASVIALSLIFWFVDIKAIHFVLMIAILFCLSFGFQMKTLHRILLTGTFTALLGITDVVAYFSQMLLLKITSEQTLFEPYYSLGILHTFTILFIVLIIVHHAHHRLFVNAYNKKFLILYTLPTATLLAIWTEYIIARNFETTNGLKILLLVDATVLILTNFIVFYFADNIYDKLQYECRLRIAEEMIAEQHQQYTSLVESGSEIRQIKHDQKNFILGALSQLHQCEYDKLEAYLINRLEHFDRFSYSPPSLYIVNAIIEYKSKYAEKLCVSIDCDTRISAKPAINDIDLAILMGNLLDNAIEAVADLPEYQNKVINVFVESDDTKIIVSITNPVLKNIDVEHLKTRKKDPDHHGYGLLAVRKIADKYSGTLLLTCQDNVFEASVVLNSV